MLKRLLRAWIHGEPRTSRNLQQSETPDRALERARGRFAAGDAAAASQIVREALASHPASPTLWNGAGIFELARGDAAAAERCFERALELAPALAEAHANLGITLAQ